MTLRDEVVLHVYVRVLHSIPISKGFWWSKSLLHVVLKREIMVILLVEDIFRRKSVFYS